jgi:nucleotide-binding universal stress UspA family protein
MYEHILVPLDGSDLAEVALPHARELAHRLQARVWLIRVVPPVFQPVLPPPAITIELAAEALAQTEHLAEEYLEQVRAQLAADGLTVHSLVARGDPATEVLAAARDVQARLIVMATHGRSGLGRWMIGSVADRVVRAATVPVLLVPARALAQQLRTVYARLLVPLDGSPLSESALPHAVALARLFSARLDLLTVVPRPGHYIESETELWRAAERGDPALLIAAVRAAREHYLAEQSARLQQDGLDAVPVIAEGEVAETILQMAQERHADCIVMATHGRSGLARWVLGSVAAKVLSAASIPVLLVRPGSSGA